MRNEFRNRLVSLYGSEAPQDGLSDRSQHAGRAFCAAAPAGGPVVCRHDRSVYPAGAPADHADHRSAEPQPDHRGLLGKSVVPPSLPPGFEKLPVGFRLFCAARDSDPVFVYHPAKREKAALMGAGRDKRRALRQLSLDRALFYDPRDELCYAAGTAVVQLHCSQRVPSCRAFCPQRLFLSGDETVGASDPPFCRAGDPCIGCYGSPCERGIAADLFPERRYRCRERILLYLASFAIRAGTRARPDGRAAYPDHDDTDPAALPV